jgi:hypothetical protein
MRSISEEKDNEVVVTKKARPDIRPEPRKEVRPEVDDENDPRARAAKRAAELREHLTTFDDGVDKFSTPPAPAGWTYEWKRRTVMGWEDPSYLSSLARLGWEPVQASRHPELMPKGYVGSIEREGQVLMERPQEITDEVKARDLRAARQQVQIKAGQLDPKGRGGLMDRADADATMKVKKSYEAMPIPD